MDETKTVQEPQAADTHPEESGEGGRLFTQDDVNRIVTERLAREREKAARPDPLAERERALLRRETALSCREYLREKGLPEELTEIVGAEDAPGFEAAVTRLLKLFPEIDPALAAETPVFTRGTLGGSPKRDPLAEAFKLK